MPESPEALTSSMADDKYPSNQRFQSIYAHGNNGAITYLLDDYPRFFEVSEA